jgi:AcrR family transcriptional regulator
MSSKLSRRDRNKEDKRLRIQAAAMRLFRQRGYEATTTKAIADAAGVAAGTVFLYAADKADLLVLAMHDELQRIVGERFESLPAAQLLEQLVHVFGGFLSFYEAHEEVAAPFVQTTVARRAASAKNAMALDRLTIETLGRVAGLIEAAKARGELTADVPPLLLAQNCFALYFSSLAAWLREYVNTMDEAKGMMRIALELQLRGLRR